MAERFFEKDIAHKIGYFCAPVILGIKAANTATVLSPEYKKIQTLLQGTKIQSQVLWHKELQMVLLLYRKELLQRNLENDENRAFMDCFGYEGLSLQECLLHLAKRFTNYKHTGISFPHEIGIFLDYPLEDVKNFIANKGKNALFTGFWKVYTEPERAKETFFCYQYARRLLWDALEQGGRINRIKI